MSEWFDPEIKKPDTSRTVIVKLISHPDGCEHEAFYWRAEVRWYLENGSKKRKHAVTVVAWREKAGDA